MQVRSIVGPTALSLLGRFAGASPAIASFASKIAETEQAQSDGLVCDVSFLPSFQGLNVIYRPGLRAAEIGLHRPLREATAPRQLDLGQLYLRAGERLELYSAELGCAVHPRISCAYNQRLVNDTLFRILAAVQNHEDSLSRIWNWGLQALRPQTPRVSFDDLILCPARWRITI